MNYLFEKRARLELELTETKALIEVFCFLKLLGHDYGEGEQKIVSDYDFSQWERLSNRSVRTWQYLRQELIHTYQYTTSTEGIEPPFTKELDKRIKKYFRVLDSKNGRGY